MMKNYRELIRLPTIEERYEYLRIGGQVGHETFGFNRYLNQAFYTSDEWKKLRRDAIVRDNACDLGVEGFDIYKCIMVHHIIPITVEDILKRNPLVLSLDNVICCSRQTHQAIHYGDVSLLPRSPIERRPGDHILWSSLKETQ